MKCLLRIVFTADLVLHRLIKLNHTIWNLGTLGFRKNMEDPRSGKIFRVAADSTRTKAEKLLVNNSS